MGVVLSIWHISSPDPYISSELQTHIFKLFAHLIQLTLLWAYGHKFWFVTKPLKYFCGRNGPQCGISVTRRVYTSRVNWHLPHASVYWELGYHESILTNVINSRYTRKWDRFWSCEVVSQISITVVPARYCNCLSLPGVPANRSLSQVLSFNSHECARHWENSSE